MSFIFSGFLGIFILIAGKLLTPFALDFMELSVLAKASASSYLNIIFYCAPILTFALAADSIFRGDGDAVRPMIVMIVANVINAALDPFLINGLWIFPKLGVAGAAWATLFAEIVAVITFVILFVRRKYKVKFHKEFGFFPSVSRIIYIGVPVASISVGFSIIYLFLTKIITKFGDAPLAAVTIGHRIEGIPFFIAHGLATAVATLVGQNIGARQFDRVKESFKICLSYTNIILIFFCLLFFFGAPFIYALYKQPANVVFEGSRYLMICAVFEIFMGWEIIAGAAFSGTGNTMPTLFISLPLSILRIPLAYYLAIDLQMGVTGIWWAISATTLLKGIVLVFWWTRNRWILHANKHLPEIETSKSQRLAIPASLQIE
ncbi:MAG: MATE family efflux transporter [Planctomycetes bacterium]|nr:MATE family efflux transporter [Planctomycetota bacterium]